VIDPRDHISEGLSRERLKMEAKRAAKPAAFFIVGAIAALAIYVLLVTQISPTFGKKAYEARFEVDTAFGVFEGFDQVRFLGVPAGTITAIEREGDQIVLVAEIQEEYGPVYRDARATLRPITPLNDVYLDIVDPGTPEAGEANPEEPLAESQTTTNVTVPDVLDTLQPDQRLGLHRVLDQLGNGLADGGANLRRAFVSATPFLEEAGELTRQIALRKRVTKRLVENTTILTEELGRREAEIRRLVNSGSVALGALQEGSADLDATLAELGPAADELVTTLAGLRGALDDIDSGIAALYPVAEQLPDALADVRALSSDLDPAIRSLDPLVERLLDPLRSALSLSRNGTSAARALRPQVPVLDRLTRRLVDCEDGVIGFFQWNASLSKWGDATAPIPRGTFAIGVPDVGVGGLPKREPPPACTPGVPIRDFPTPEDGH